MSASLLRIRTTIYRAYRAHAARSRTRREHDYALDSDPRFALEHRLQVARSIDAGTGGCPFCP